MNSTQAVVVTFGSLGYMGRPQDTTKEHTPSWDSYNAIIFIDPQDCQQPHTQQYIGEVHYHVSTYSKGEVDRVRYILSFSKVTIFSIHFMQTLISNTYIRSGGHPQSGKQLE